jgi:hypothetical protein
VTVNRAIQWELRMRVNVWGVDVEAALERGFRIAFTPALVGSLVSQLPS